MSVKLFLLPILVGVIWIIGICVYNLFFHPLRNYPGPLLARATRLYSLIWDIRGLSHWKIKEWHDKYGEVIRTAPDELSYTKPEAWQTIYGFPNREGTGNFEKNKTWWNATVSGVQTILTADDEGHRRMRRLQNPAFSDKALKARESVIAGNSSLLIHQLQQQASDSETATVDLVSWTNHYTFDNIVELVFGESFHCLRDSKSHFWLSSIYDMLELGTYMRATRRFYAPLSNLLMRMIPKRFFEDQKRQFCVSIEQVKKRLEEETDRPDFMSFLIEATEKKTMSTEEMFVAAQVLVVTGAETTATGITLAIYLLLSNPRTFRILSAEIRNRFQNEKDITLSSTAELSYLSAVLEETLRVAPPSVGNFPRTVPMPGKMVCGQYVPEGFTVGVHQLSMNRSPRNFREPDSFIPERWIPGNADFQNDQKSASQPFSCGPRNCIGKNLAYTEMRIALCRIVWNFDMNLDPQSVGWLSRQKTYVSWMKEEMKVQLMPRV